MGGIEVEHAVDISEFSPFLGHHVSVHSQVDNLKYWYQDYCLLGCDAV